MIFSDIVLFFAVMHMWANELLTIYNIDKGVVINWKKNAVRGAC